MSLDKAIRSGKEQSHVSDPQGKPAGRRKTKGIRKGDQIWGFQ